MLQKKKTGVNAVAKHDVIMLQKNINILDFYNFI